METIREWSGQNGGPSGEVHLVGRTHGEWKKIQKLFPVLGSESVDLSIHMVVAIGLGTQMSGGYGVTIVEISENGDVLHIKYQTRSPKPGEFVTQAITSPFHIVVVAPTSKAQTVQFEPVTSASSEEEPL